MGIGLQDLKQGLLMSKQRKLWFRIHSWIGVKLSILFFIVCFSGTLATLSHEMDWLFNPAIRAAPQPELASRNLIVENFREAFPGAKLTYWLRHDEPYLCDILYVERDGKRSYAFANPYTGVIQGEAALTIQRFFRDLHYFLFIPFQIGHFTVLLFAFLLLISLATALAFYKNWWRKLFVLETRKGLLVFFRSLHRLVGLWSVPFTLLFSITGIWYFLERADVGGIGRVSNPPLPPITTIGGPSEEMPAVSSVNLDYDQAVQAAKKAIPGLSVGSILPVESADHPIYLTGKSEVPLVRQRANRVYLHPLTYEPVGIQRAEAIGTVMWLNDIADPLHFGSWGGLVTKIIWFVMGLGISSLVLSGIWITLKRRALSRKRAGEPVMGRWRYLNWGFYLLMSGFMYHALLTRYGVSIPALSLITPAWGIALASAYYLFVYRIQRVAS